MARSLETSDSVTRPMNLRIREEICDLSDQTLVRVDRQTYDYFIQVLDQPPGGEGFERLMRADRPWMV